MGTASLRPIQPTWSPKKTLKITFQKNNRWFDNDTYALNKQGICILCWCIVNEFLSRIVLAAA